MYEWNGPARPKKHIVVSYETPDGTVVSLCSKHRQRAPLGAVVCKGRHSGYCDHCEELWEQAKEDYRSRKPYYARRLP